MILFKKSHCVFSIILYLCCPNFQSHATPSPKVNNDSIKRFRHTLLPAAGYEPETSTKIGAASFMIIKARNVQSKFYRPSTISSYFLYTFNRQILFKTKWKLNLGEAINITTDFQYFDYPEQFFGIGKSVDVENSEQFVNRFINFEGRIFKRLNEKTFTGFRYNIQHNWLEELEMNGQILGDQIVGARGGKVIGFGPALKYDSRDHTLFPRSGMLMALDLSVVSELFGSDYEYVSYKLDWRGFQTIVNDRNVVALQTNIKLTSGGVIPFYKLPALGGIHRLRGIQNSKLYRDRHAVYGQVEYRRDLPWRLGLTVFGGIGSVAYQLKDLSLEGLKHVIGGGIRYQMMKDEDLNLRLDWGVGPKGQSAFYIAIKEAF